MVSGEVKMMILVLNSTVILDLKMWSSLQGILVSFLFVCFDVINALWLGTLHEGCDFHGWAVFFLKSLDMVFIYTSLHMNVIYLEGTSFYFK